MSAVVSEKPFDSILVVYGSQTGNAEAIGKDVYRKLAAIGGVSVECLSMSAYVNSDLELARLNEYDLLVGVLSTTGQGDPPDSAHKFLRAVKKLTSNALANLRFTVLALGDTNYADYAQTRHRARHHAQEQGGNTHYSLSESRRRCWFRVDR